MLDPHKIILHPFVTEKTMNLMEMEKEIKKKAKKRQMESKKNIVIRENKLVFVVRRDATKKQIKMAFEQLFDVKVEKVNTMILKTGKHAIIKLAKGYSAEDVGMRIGIF